jgi:hypothetical protein
MGADRLRSGPATAQGSTESPARHRLGRPPVPGPPKQGRIQRFGGFDRVRHREPLVAVIAAFRVLHVAMRTHVTRRAVRAVTPSMGA